MNKTDAQEFHSLTRQKGYLNKENVSALLQLTSFSFLKQYFQFPVSVVPYIFFDQRILAKAHLEMKLARDVKKQHEGLLQLHQQ